ncbi:MAG: DNA methyltransferase [Desulfobacterales bacterium]
MAKEQAEKMTGTSFDAAAENRTRLKSLFPAVFTETVNDDGELTESVDFEKLKAELGTFTDLFESRRERYGMDWPGKKDALRLIQTPSTATLKPCRGESVNFDSTEHLFIEGENLEVLKLLQKSYYSKVKMIYIDPPYNTGKEFIYPDNFSERIETYLEYAGLIDGQGRRFSTNTASEGRFHTKWLNMMYPRLYLARNLLRDDGVIFISIDDNEVSNLRKLCDEIFGEENFVANIVWQRRDTPANDAKGFSQTHEYCLVYSKTSNYSRSLLPRSEEQLKNYQNPDEDPRGPWTRGALTRPGQSEKDCYPIINPQGKKCYPPKGTSWRVSKRTLERLTAENKLWWGKSDDGDMPFQKRFLSDVQDGVVPITWWDYKFSGSMRNAKMELRDLFGNDPPFDYPKPSSYIKKLLLTGDSKEDIVLDFFAGSATTAHAVLDLNKQDSGNRKFILVQLPEPCAKESEAFKAGYKTIADIGKERIRRVIRKIEKEQTEKEIQAKSILPGMGEERKQPDLGFKVFRLDKSNFRQWQKLDPSTPPDRIEEELLKHVNHISPKAAQEDLLYEILLKAGFMLTEKMEQKTIAGKTVFSVADGALLLCLEDTVTKELIDAVAEMEPMQFICPDSAFQGNDQLKTNAVQTFAARSRQRDRQNQTVFRTV